MKLWFKVNEELRQEGETSSMIFSISYIISYISKIMTLENEISSEHQKELDPLKKMIFRVINMRFMAKSTRTSKEFQEERKQDRATNVF